MSVSSKVILIVIIILLLMFVFVMQAGIGVSLVSKAERNWGDGVLTRIDGRRPG